MLSARVRSGVVLSVGFIVSVLVAAGIGAALDGDSPSNTPDDPTFAAPRDVADVVDVADVADVADAGATAPVPSGADGGIASAEDQVEFWGARVEADPDDYLSRTELAGQLVRRARATHNLDDATEAERHLAVVLEINPSYGPARALSASARMMFHDFAAARTIAQSAYDDDPENLVALSTVGDAAYELGDLDAAADVYRQLASAVGQVGPVPFIVSREARVAAALGDTDRAIQLATSAAASATGSGTELAYYDLLLGELLRVEGRLDEAAASYEKALAAAPEYGAAIESLAKVRAAQGDLDGSELLWRRSGELIGAPDFHVLAALGDIAWVRGDEAAAERSWDAALDAVAALPEEQRVGFLRDESRFLVDHDRDPQRALELAEADLRKRQDALAYDTLAWALAANGRWEEARDAVEKALAPGARDTLVVYHAAVVLEHEGAAAEARDLLAPALARNPGFDLLLAPRAEALLAKLS